MKCKQCDQEAVARYLCGRCYQRNKMQDPVVYAVHKERARNYHRRKAMPAKIIQAIQFLNKVGYSVEVANA